MGPPAQNWTRKMDLELKLSLFGSHSNCQSETCATFRHISRIFFEYQQCSGPLNWFICSARPSFLRYDSLFLVMWWNSHIFECHSKSWRKCFPVLDKAKCNFLLLWKSHMWIFFCVLRFDFLSSLFLAGTNPMLTNALQPFYGFQFQHPVVSKIIG